MNKKEKELEKSLLCDCKPLVKLSKTNPKRKSKFSIKKAVAVFAVTALVGYVAFLTSFVPANNSNSSAKAATTTSASYNVPTQTPTTNLTEPASGGSVATATPTADPRSSLTNPFIAIATEHFDATLSPRNLTAKIVKKDENNYTVTLSWTEPKIIESQNPGDLGFPGFNSINDFAGYEIFRYYVGDNTSGTSYDSFSSLINFGKESVLRTSYSFNLDAGTIRSATFLGFFVKSNFTTGGLIGKITGSDKKYSNIAYLDVRDPSKITSGSTDTPTSSSAPTGIAGFFNNTIRNVMTGFFAAADVVLVSTIKSFGSWLIQTVAFDMNIGADSAIQNGWNAMKNLANIIFAFLLMYIAIANIANYKIDTYAIKKVLPRFIFAVIAINLSFWIIQQFLIAVQFVQMSILGAIKDTSGIGQAWQSLFDPTKYGLSETTFVTSIDIWSVLPSFFLYLIILVLFIAALGFLLLYLFFRILIIWLLIIVSPVAISFSVLKGTEKYWNQWWETLLNLLLVGPLVAICLLLATLVLTSSSGATDLLTIFNLSGGDTTTAQALTGSKIGKLLLATLLMFASVIVPNSISGKIIPSGEKFMRGALGFGVGAGLGLQSNLIRAGGASLGAGALALGNLTKSGRLKTIGQTLIQNKGFNPVRTWKGLTAGLAEKEKYVQGNIDKNWKARLGVIGQTPLGKLAGIEALGEKRAEDIIERATTLAKWTPKGIAQKLLIKGDDGVIRNSRGFLPTRRDLDDDEAARTAIDFKKDTPLSPESREQLLQLEQDIKNGTGVNYGPGKSLHGIYRNDKDEIAATTTPSISGTRTRERALTNAQNTQAKLHSMANDTKVRKLAEDLAAATDPNPATQQRIDQIVNSLINDRNTSNTAGIDINRIADAALRSRFSNTINQAQTLAAQVRQNTTEAVNAEFDSQRPYIERYRNPSVRTAEAGDLNEILNKLTRTQDPTVRRQVLSQPDMLERVKRLAYTPADIRTFTSNPTRAIDILSVRQRALETAQAVEAPSGQVRADGSAISHLDEAFERIKADRERAKGTALDQKEEDIARGEARQAVEKAQSERIFRQTFPI